MPLLSKSALYVVQNPITFVRQVLTSFNRNQGLLLAGAIAYYALLSVVPLLIVSVIVLSQLLDQAELLATLGRYLEWLVPSQSKAVLADVSSFLDNGTAIGVVLLGTMLFFSSLAFSVLGKAMAIIFGQRENTVQRHFLVAAVLPYSFVVLLGIALFAVTLASVGLQALGQEHLHLFGSDWSLGGPAIVLLYLLGLAVETLVLSALYLALPIRRMPVHHALIGGFTAAMLWEVLRHGLIWYFATLSSASIVYGSLSTAVVVLFSMELAATVVLLGAQVIAEFQRVGETPAVDR